MHVDKGDYQIFLKGYSFRYFLRMQFLLHIRQMKTNLCKTVMENNNVYEGVYDLPTVHDLTKPLAFSSDIFLFYTLLLTIIVSKYGDNKENKVVIVIIPSTEILQTRFSFFHIKSIFLLLVP